MIIISIDIRNFLSYYGPNRFDFDKGANIILGQNNTGKSKLFDAFNWVLYDRAYKTEEGQWRDTRDWGHEIANWKAQGECSERDSVDVEVSLSFEEDKFSYFLSRGICVERKENTWKCPAQSNVTLTVTDKVTSNVNDYYDLEAIEQLRAIFPDNLSRYFLYQGESVNQIMSLRDKSAFKNALLSLSRIEVFEKANDYTDKVVRRTKKELDGKVEKDQKTQNQKLFLSGEIERLKAGLEKKKQEYQNESVEMEKAKHLLDKANEEISQYNECANLLNEIEQTKERLRLMNENRGTRIEGMRDKLLGIWMYAGTDRIWRGFADLYAKNKIEQNYPEPIRQVYIREMLNEELCKVCGRPAAEGSDEYRAIESKLDEHSLGEEYGFIRSLGIDADSTMRSIQQLPEEIAGFAGEIKKIDDALVAAGRALDGKNDQLRQVLPAGTTEDLFSLTDFQKLQRARDQYDRDWESSKSRVRQMEGSIAQIQQEIESREKEYTKVTESSSAVEEKGRYELAQRIAKSTKMFYDHFLHHLIDDIQGEANDCFCKMTEMNPALSGRVRVDYDNKEVYIIAEDGLRMSNINQGNKVSLQISFVSAVLAVSNRFWDTYFPFIADAPVSDLGGNNRLPAVRSMTEAFQQSIIMLKDEAVTNDPASMRSDHTRNLIQESDLIGHSYELKIEGKSERDQYTKIIRLK